VKIKRWVFKHPFDPHLTVFTDQVPSQDLRFRGYGRYNKRKGMAYIWELADGIAVESFLLRVSLDDTSICPPSCKRAKSPAFRCACRACMSKNHGRELDIHLGEHEPITDLEVLCKRCHSKEHKSQ